MPLPRPRPGVATTACLLLGLGLLGLVGARASVAAQPLPAPLPPPAVPPPAAPPPPRLRAAATLAPDRGLPALHPPRLPAATVATAADAATRARLAAAGAALRTGDYPRAQALFEQAATGTSGRARFEYWLLAAETAHLTERPADVARLLAPLDRPDFVPDSPRQQLRLDLLRAELRLAAGDAADVARRLPADTTEADLRDRLLYTRARALFRVNDPVPAVQALVRREAVLRPEDLADNRRTLWAQLTLAHPHPQLARRLDGLDPVSRGWLELALLLDRGAGPAALAGWRARFPGHPATPYAERLGLDGGALPAAPDLRLVGLSAPTTLSSPSSAPLRLPVAAAAPTAARAAPRLPVEGLPLPLAVPSTAAAGAPGTASSIAALSPALTPAPAPEAATGGLDAAGFLLPPPPAGSRRVALILPLTGPLRPQAQSLQVGAEAAARRAGDVQVTLYDSGAESPETLLGRALAAGATAVIGPVRRDDVQRLAARGAPALPVLALNYTDGPPPRNLVPLGLAPEDEARAAARLALRDGRRRMVLIAYEGDRGARALAAFETVFVAGGGAVAARLRFAPGQRDYAGLTAQLPRRAPDPAAAPPAAPALPAARPLGPPPPPPDADAVFLVARPQAARQIWTRLRAENVRLPGYAPSEPNGGSPDRDLTGLVACDMPWLLLPDNPARRPLLANAPAAGTDRLFALGVDSVRLSTDQVLGRLRGGYTYAGIAGTWYVAVDGSLHRRLACRDLGLRGPVQQPD